VCVQVVSISRSGKAPAWAAEEVTLSLSLSLTMSLSLSLSMSLSMSLSRVGFRGGNLGLHSNTSNAIVFLNL
jgi:hypothetical protein